MISRGGVANTNSGIQEQSSDQSNSPRSKRIHDILISTESEQTPLLQKKREGEKKETLSVCYPINRSNV